MIRLGLAAAAAFCFVNAGGALAQPGSAQSQTPAYISAVEAQFDRVVAAERVVGFAAAVIENGQPVLVYTHGEAAAGAGSPVTPDTLFRAASVTKTFTGTLMAVLEQEGRLDLSAEIPPDIMTLQGSRQPTIEEILSHRTGLPPNAYDNILEAGRPVDGIRDRLSDVDLICPVGSCYSYQNVAFAAVEPVVENALGQSYAAVLANELFERLALPSASLGADALQQEASWAAPHRGWRRTGDQAGSPNSPYDNTPSAAGVNLSLNDMIAWAQIQLGSRPGLAPEVRDRAHARITETRRETRRLGALSDRVSGTWYGLGWRVYDWQDRTLVLHSGYLSGYGAQIVLEPETGFGFVALWNSDNRPTWWLWPAVMDLRTGASDGNRWLDRFDEE